MLMALFSSVRPIQRLVDFPRTLWQLGIVLRCGLTGLRTATEVIDSKTALQRRWELLGMMARVRELKPAVVVEIGTYKGGTLRCWAQVCPADTEFISIDLPGGPFGGG